MKRGQNPQVHALSNLRICVRNVGEICAVWGLTTVAGGGLIALSQLPGVVSLSVAGGGTSCRRWVWDLGVCDTFDTFDMLSREKRRSARQNFQISGSCENFQTPGAVGKIALWVALSQKQPVKTCHPVLGSYTCTTPATAGALTAPLATARFDCTPGNRTARGGSNSRPTRENTLCRYTTNLGKSQVRVGEETWLFFLDSSPRP